MVFHPDIKVLAFAFYIRYIPSNKNKCTTTIDIMKYFAWFIDFMTVTAVELFQKVVLNNHTSVFNYMTQMLQVNKKCKGNIIQTNIT